MPSYKLSMSSCLYHCRDVVHMNTKQAIGYDDKNKYQICAVSNAWHFFFINSNPQGKFMQNHIEINKNDWQQMKYIRSFVLISDIFCYSEDEVYNGTSQYGSVTEECMKRVVKAALSSSVMEKWKKDLIRQHLAEYMEP